MDAETGQLQALLELEARHDDLLERLAELDARVEQTLKQYAPQRRQGGPSAEGAPVSHGGVTAADRDGLTC